MQQSGFVPADTLLKMQREQQRSEDARVRRSSVWGLTWDTAEADTREAVTGIIGDLHGSSSRKSVWDVFAHGDRLRGLGIVLLIIALAGCAVQGLMSD